MPELRGLMTALVTPFRGDEIDVPTFQKLVERQIKGGASGLVVAGTTGESPALDHDDYRRLVRATVEAARGRVPVIAGAGANVTRHAIELAKYAEEDGADALLAVTGYYNKPSQAGLIAHFRALHDAVGLPVLLYNVPGRTVANLSVETIATLAALPRIVGVKDATGDLARVPLQRAACGPDFALISGEDMTAVGFNAMGGVGCISVTANVAPRLCAEMQTASIAGDFVRARTLQDQLTPLSEILFKDTSPGPVKYAMSALGLCAPDLRLPLQPPSEALQRQIRAVLERFETFE